MPNITELIGKIESSIILKHKHKYYQAVEITGKSTDTYMQFTCLDFETKQLLFYCYSLKRTVFLV